MSEAYILVVDDEPDIRSLVQEILLDEGYDVATAENGSVARSLCKERRPDLVLLDIWMPDMDGITLLKEWADAGVLPFQVIMISGHATVETAVEATRLGAYDFIEKPLSLAKLLLTVSRALEAGKLRRENLGLKQKIELFLEPLGRSAQMQELREQARRIAAHDTWVLLYGESGSGKKTFANYIHLNSLRRNGPFIEISPGAILKENSTIELFGSELNQHVHYGKLEQANGGTLFLDEIADMDHETQTRLSSALETSSFTRVGGTQSVNINVRILASTQFDLAKRVKDGLFREELYYHLNVVPFRVPSLREHADDVLELLNYYVDHFVRREHLKYRRFGVGAQNRLRNYPWSGNIRELKNLVQRLLILGGDENISPQELEGALKQTPIAQKPAAQVDENILDLPLRVARERFEREYLQHQLRICGGSVGDLAKIVGMERTNLYRKLKSLGIDVKQK